MEDTGAIRCYRVIRFYESGKKRTIHANVTLEEAQAHCRDPKSRGINWVDRYDYMPGCKPRS